MEENDVLIMSCVRLLQKRWYHSSENVHFGLLYARCKHIDCVHKLHHAF